MGTPVFLKEKIMNAG